MPNTGGRHFLQIPGPTNVPDRILRALSQPTLDHRGPEFARLAREVLEGLKLLFKHRGPLSFTLHPEQGHGRRPWSTPFPRGIRS